MYTLADSRRTADGTMKAVAVRFGWKCVIWRSTWATAILGMQWKSPISRQIWIVSKN